MNISDSEMASALWAVFLGLFGPTILVNTVHLVSFIACLLSVVGVLIFYLLKNRKGIKVTAIISIIFAVLYVVFSIIAVVYNMPVSWPT